MPSTSEEILAKAMQIADAEHETVLSRVASNLLKDIAPTRNPGRSYADSITMAFLKAWDLGIEKASMKIIKRRDESMFSFSDLYEDYHYYDKYGRKRQR